MLNKTLIIAEAGVNHNGSIEKAKLLIDAAKNAGADYVKFQTFKTELNITRSAQKAAYQIANDGESTSQFEMVKKLEFSFDDFNMLKSYCDDIGIGFMSTAFDLPSLELIDSLQDMFKIPSGEINNLPYLEAISLKSKPVIISTGMADMSEIKAALAVLEKGINKNEITVLHCNTEYPTPMEDVNLKAMLTIGHECGVKVGYSDHTLGIEVPIAAVALGATVIEKHFTLDRSLPGPDHRASLEPNELKRMVDALRNIEAAISGSGKKTPSESEIRNIEIIRKSLHLNKDLKKGTVLSSNDLIALRPATGISPMQIEEVIGKGLTKDVEAFNPLKEEDIS
ncbi:MAG TPA: N-acetylneuraminate synthase [Flavobacteriales bacterium]|nr:N-acetylneuraminate synthase [Flavobacteriales bacterium]